MDLLEKMRKARESSVKIDNITLVFRRPTDMDAMEMKYPSIRDGMEGVSQFVIGWKDVQEKHILPNGSDMEVSFDPNLFKEWIKDQPEMWEPLLNAVINAYTAYREKRDQEGNA